MSLFKSKDEKMAETLQESILEGLDRTKNLVEGFGVEFSDGVATLSGTCDTPKTREKAILFARMAEGVTDVQSDRLHISEQYSEPAAETAEEPEAEERAPQASSPKAAEPSEVESRSVQPGEADAESRMYTIQSGDSLSKIARQFYGNANKYMFIFEANREIIKDPDNIYPGQEIRIPPLG